MKRIALLAVVALVALGFMPATAGAGVPGTGKVTIVHDATFSATAPFPVTLCVNGEPFAGGVGQTPFVWGDVLGPVELPAATYVISIYGGAVAVCEGEPAIGPRDLVVEAGDDITAAAIWTSDGLGLTVWPNDSSCLAPDTARLTVRHGADTDGKPVDVVATVGGQQITVIANLAQGAQAAMDGPAPLVATDVAVTGAGVDVVLIEIGDVTLEPGTNYVVYAGGGNDGPAGVFIDPIPLDVCAVPVTTPTTEPAPAAQAVAARPAFTG